MIHFEFAAEKFFLYFISLTLSCLTMTYLGARAAPLPVATARIHRCLPLATSQYAASHLAHAFGPHIDVRNAHTDPLTPPLTICSLCYRPVANID
jgi:hypothetical protein